MNVFILCTGRCGSQSLIAASKHITNFSCAHESRNHLLGTERFNYPALHIEADNRLAWFLGRLDKCYGDNAIYVHLHRAKTKTVQSYAKRLHRGGLMNAFRYGILFGVAETASPIAIAEEVVDTINANISLFLKDKTHTMVFHTEQANTDFKTYWNLIGAQGNYEAALAAFEVIHDDQKHHKFTTQSRVKRIFQQLSNLKRAKPK